MILANVRTESEVLDRVTVRLLREDERSQFDYYLQEEHYLESSRLVGEWLRYVAEVDGQWVALLTFSASALHLKARERWLGWSPRQRARRLGLIVNNSRFLVLPERQRYPNLASRILGMALRRLSADWQERWGHPVLVVESFVDKSRLVRSEPPRALAELAGTFIKSTGNPSNCICVNCARVPANGCDRLACRRNWPVTKPTWRVRARSEHPPWKVCWIASVACPIHATAMGCVIGNGLCWPAPLSVH